MNAQTPRRPPAQARGSSPSWHQFQTIAVALAVVNSLLTGGTLGLAVQAGTGTRWPETSRGSERPGARRGKQRQRHRQPMDKGPARMGADPAP